MIITKKALSRRTLLRGLGTAIALPMLDSMRPALAAAKAPAVRTAYLYVPNGIIMKDWTPKGEGTTFELGKTLQPLAPMREHITFLTGLDHYNGQSLGDGAGDHARAGATWLTGVHPKKTQGRDILAGTSIDQLAAKEIGKNTTLPSLELGLDDNRMVGGCDSGYSCAYSNTLCWSSPTTPLPLETNPRAIFERLFGDGDTTDPAARAALARQDKSILDFARADAARVGLGLGTGDKRKLGEYLDAVREIEIRIQKMEKQAAESAALPAIDQPPGIPPTFEEHIKLVFDLMTVAFQADLTRIITLMIGREGGNRTYRSIGVPDAHHGLSHHFNDPAKIERLQKIDQHHVEMTAYFLDKLSKTPDGDGTLLDNSMILYGSSISDGNRHEHLNLPTFLAGHGGGKIKGGRHLVASKGTPMTNLFLSMLDLSGVRVDKFGDSNGRLETLSNLT